MSYNPRLINTSITQAIHYIGTLNQTISYGKYYTLLDLPQELIYAGATQILDYDKDGLLVKSGDYTINRVAKTGRVTDIIDGNYRQKFLYNEYGELDSKEDSFNGNRLYKYDIVARTISGKIEIKTEQGIGNKPVVYGYTYDLAGRLTEVESDGEITESYKYDNNGNRLEAIVNNIITKGYYTLEDQLEVYGDNTYRYDEDGYLSEKITPDGTTAYDYGTLGELIKVATPSKTISYLQNANNQRVAKLIDSKIVEKYLWANLTTLLAIYDKDDNLVQRFDYTDSRMPISMTMGADKYYLHYDQVGSLRAVSDSSGNIVKEVFYDTFCNILSDSNLSFKVPFGFAGGLYDSDTNLTRFGYRDYDAYTGKWTAKDPIGFGGGDSNLYGYVLGDGVNFVDPMGLAKHDPNSNYCKNLRRKLKNIQNKIKQRYNELETDTQALQQISKNGQLGDSIKGHEIMITKARKNFYTIADRYDDECGGPPSGGNCEIQEEFIVDFTATDTSRVNGIILGMTAVGVVIINVFGTIFAI